MISRKKKIITTQFFLFIAGSLLILSTYLLLKSDTSEKILTNEIKEEIDKKIKKKKNTENIFYDIEYSGIDVSGNRYILKAKEAINNDKIDSVVNLKFVNAFFYFKDNKILKISSNNGLYNNKTLDMTFENDVKSSYDTNILTANKAEYFNSKSYLIITENVKIKDLRGTIIAEKLIFDLKKNTLDISSTDEKKINANINIK